MATKITIDHAGIGEILKSREMAAAIDDLADELASSVRDGISDPDIAAAVGVDHYVTDRAAAAVTIAHPAGMGLQATQGALTRAAANAGLDVKARTS